jgi:hypothetical protein
LIKPEEMQIRNLGS